MQDLEFSRIFFGSLGIGSIFFLYFHTRLRLWQIWKINAKKSLQKIKNKERPFFYNSYYTKQTATRKFFHQSATAEAKIYIALSTSLKKGEKNLKKAIEQSPKNWKLLLLYADICLIQNKRVEFGNALNNLHLPFLTPSALRADYLRLSALNDLYQTNMYDASKKLSKALKIYQKNSFTYEEAECYLALGQTYRISGVFDVAYTMFQEAEKLYKSMELSSKQAEAVAYQGLLEISRENYKTSEEYFTQAEKICQEHHLSQTLNDIKNWHGLALYLQAKEKEAIDQLAADKDAKIAEYNDLFTALWEVELKGFLINGTQNNSQHGTSWFSQSNPYADFAVGNDINDGTAIPFNNQTEYAALYAQLQLITNDYNTQTQSSSFSVSTGNHRIILWNQK